MAGTRYAIYFAPDQASALWRFGSDAIGYDAVTGQVAPPTPIPGVPTEERQKMVEDPGRYGFHATFKAPVELRSDVARAALIESAHAFGASTRAFSVRSLAVTSLGSFLALMTPDPDDHAALAALADAAVEAFEPLRSPLSEHDRQRRLAAGMTPRQTEYLDRYGYPYVREEFRFHMTLTGRLPPDRQGLVRAALAEGHATTVGSSPVAIDRIAVFEQIDRGSHFRIIASAMLS